MSIEPDPLPPCFPDSLEAERELHLLDERRRLLYGPHGSHIRDQLRQARDERDRYRQAIEDCIGYANGRESEWGNRAIACFEILERALNPEEQS